MGVGQVCAFDKVCVRFWGCSISAVSQLECVTCTKVTQQNSSSSQSGSQECSVKVIVWHAHKLAQHLLLHIKMSQ